MEIMFVICVMKARLFIFILFISCNKPTDEFKIQPILQEQYNYLEYSIGNDSTVNLNKNNYHHIKTAQSSQYNSWMVIGYDYDLNEPYRVLSFDTTMTVFQGFNEDDTHAWRPRDSITITGDKNEGSVSCRVINFNGFDSVRWIHVKFKTDVR